MRKRLILKTLILGFIMLLATDMKAQNDGPNGKSIYFPLGGVYYDSSELDHRNDLGYYLTASIYNEKSCRDWILRTESDCHRGWDLRWYGYSLRPVIGPNPDLRSSKNNLVRTHLPLL